MFEIGKKYEMRMIIDGKETTMMGIVEKYEYPLLKLADTVVKASGGYLEAKTIRGDIINVTSPNFISATVQD